MVIYTCQLRSPFAAKWVQVKPQKPFGFQSFLDFREGIVDLYFLFNSSPSTADQIERKKLTLLEYVSCQALSLIIMSNSNGSLKDYISIQENTTEGIVKYSHLL